MYIPLDFIAGCIFYLAFVSLFFILITFAIHYIFLGLKLASERFYDFISDRWFDGGRNTPLPVYLFYKRKAAEEEAVLNQIPGPAKYKHDRNKSECCTCAICLEDLQDGELCRTLPDCNHTFHEPCIKPWLIKNQSCPICRVNISAANKTPQNAANNTNGT